MDYPIKMKLKRDESPVNVYQISITENGTHKALVFDIAQYRKSGNGWMTLKVTQLLPIDVPVNHKEVISKTKKNKAKERLKLVEATWECSDGARYSHEWFNKAIAHEQWLMEEVEREEENK